MIDEQLTHLADLHRSGALTDDEFAAAKASAIGTGSAGTGTTTSPVPPAPVVPVVRADGAPGTAGALPPPASGDATVLTGTEALARIPWILVVVLALVAGTAVHALTGAFEWEAFQVPAAPVVCPGGVMHSGYDVSYSVNTKGVSDAVTCERDGVTTPVGPWVVFGVLSVIYAVPFFLLLAWLRVRSRRRLRARVASSSPGP